MAIDITQVTACLITTEERYPALVFGAVARHPFGTIIARTHCYSLHLRYKVIEQATTKYVYVQDDDCITDIAGLMAAADPVQITCAMKPHYLGEYAAFRDCLVGWGAVFDREQALDCLGTYLLRHDEDSIYKRECDRILTYLWHPQLRLQLDIEDMPWATSADRMSMQHGHYAIRDAARERCKEMV